MDSSLCSKLEVEKSRKEIISEMDHMKMSINTFDKVF